MHASPVYRRGVALFTTMLLSAGIATAQVPGQSPMPAAKGTAGGAAAQPPGTRLGPTDTSFLIRAAEGGLFEVEAGKLAASRGQHEQVRAFGEKLAADHAKSNARLAALAKEYGVTLPGAVPAKEEIILERLRRLSGTDFDRQFVQTAGIDSHRETIALFQKAVSSVQSDAVRAFAKASLPALQAHLAQAEKLALLTVKIAQDQSSTTTRP